MSGASARTRAYKLRGPTASHARASALLTARLPPAMKLAERLCLACIICADIAFSYLLRLLGPVLVLLANGLIGLVVYVYLWILVPRYLRPQLGDVLSGIIVAFGLFLLFNILFNYWCCVLTRPGAPADQLPPFEDLEAAPTSPTMARAGGRAESARAASRRGRTTAPSAAAAS